jgi:polyisoprenoid-binding protein YceI
MRLLALFSVLLFAAPALADDWKVDPSHVSVVFKINHAGFSDTYGFFPGVSGAVKTGAQGLESVEVTIKAETINSGFAKRDGHLRSPDFFNTAQHPTITFKSTAIKKTGDNTYAVVGNLTMLGQTKSVSTTITQHKVGEFPKGTTRTGFSGELNVKRSDFGMKYGLPAIGDDVKLMLSIEAVKG